jgi:hypothetical protein
MEADADHLVSHHDQRQRFSPMRATVDASRATEEHIHSRCAAFAFPNP